MDKIYYTGAIPSPADKRDYVITNLIACSENLPEEHKNPIIDIAPVYDQGATNSCVACSLALMRWLQEYNQSGNKDMFSAAYIYGARNSGMYQGEGMIAREALQIIRKKGDCLWSELPGYYNYAVSKQKSTAIDSAKAYPFRISSFYSVGNMSQIKTAVLNLGAVTAVFPVYQCLYNAERDGIIRYTGAENTGDFHQMTIVGWDKNGWIIRNSWGVK